MDDIEKRLGQQLSSGPSPTVTGFVESGSWEAVQEPRVRIMPTYKDAAGRTHVQSVPPEHVQDVPADEAGRMQSADLAQWFSLLEEYTKSADAKMEAAMKRIEALEEALATVLSK